MDKPKTAEETTDTHADFHRKAASSARQTARDYFRMAKYDRDNPLYTKGLTFDQMADLHDLAAHGTMAFDDCPDCMNIRRQDH
jgi:hypothetical protein